MGLQHTYRFIAPIYDKIVANATYSMRKKSIEQIVSVDNKKILLSGIGTGLDIPHLDPVAEYHGIDITPNMLKKIPREALSNLHLCVGNVMKLPYADNSFDIVLMHLILAVVPDPQQALLEAARITKPEGKIIILDKFIRPGQKAYMRRLISPFLGLLITQTNVVFENLLTACPNLNLISDEPTELSNWFRRIELQKI
ncbi:MAG: class I SAM-dependent methyltransferase [Gammaproteobacteria bacterium]